MSKDGIRSYTPAIILTVSLFFLWGMANNLNDILIAQFKKAFTLSDFETSLVQQSFYMGYFLLAIPAAFLTRAKGYKASIVTGLLLYSLGALLFYPAAHYGQYAFFLAALFIIACGLAFLETAANPLMTELGDPSGATRRLNWAQAANPAGTLTGVLIGKFFILSDIVAHEAALEKMPTAARQALLRDEILAVQTPYLLIGLLVLTFAAAASLIDFPKGSLAQGQIVDRPRFRMLFKHKTLLFATVAQFFYVGAQVGIWSYTIRYAQANVPGIGERSAADYLFASLVLFGLGRVIGTALMARIGAGYILSIFAGASLVLTALAALVGGRPGLFMLVSASFFMSIQFPTIFALGVGGLGVLRRLGSSLLVMAIIGGAALTALMGYASDLTGINGALIVPTVCFIAVVCFGWNQRTIAAAPDITPHNQ
ncbi:MAG: L-fucose:H+ symporter permease [Sphingobium sp.]|nr:L-fucose:H+ symporter permease [Sphingobium sp.]PZU12670.1 MAG: L-fucose:H+ symporter permease [Sphingobium sp.]